MGDFSSQHHRKNGSGTNPASRAGTANLIPYQPGQSGNPGGRPRGISRLSHCYERLLRLSVEELQQFKPTNTAEAMALRQVVAAVYGWDALPAVKEITDRTEGKPIQRRIDLSEDEAISRARSFYALLQSAAVKVTEKLSCAQCGAITITHEDMVDAVLEGTEAQHHEAVRRALAD